MARRGPSFLLVRRCAGLGYLRHFRGRASFADDHGCPASRAAAGHLGGRGFSQGSRRWSLSLILNVGFGWGLRGWPAAEKARWEPRGIPVAERGGFGRRSVWAGTPGSLELGHFVRPSAEGSTVRLRVFGIRVGCWSWFYLQAGDSPLYVVELKKWFGIGAAGYGSAASRRPPLKPRPRTRAGPYRAVRPRQSSGVTDIEVSTQVRPQDQQRPTGTANPDSRLAHPRAPSGGRTDGAVAHALGKQRTASRGSGRSPPSLRYQASTRQHRPDAHDDRAHANHRLVGTPCLNAAGDSG